LLIVVSVINVLLVCSLTTKQSSKMFFFFFFFKISNHPSELQMLLYTLFYGWQQLQIILKRHLT